MGMTQVLQSQIASNSYSDLLRYNNCHVLYKSSIIIHEIFC